MILKDVYIYILPCSICFMCVLFCFLFKKIIFLNVFFAYLYLYNTALFVLFCVNKYIIIINYISI